ncbi:threonine synthase [Methylobacterium nodulans]|uniref:Threonine synthase n=1 Tax=Methylobacterium nodulans (strain LMG 21967 / CNCM I-2342 / ORS 2060) TaxID=460265 RepID=B8I9Q9_METNO|nr:threonine synthase [Methylobacterium nodulans]ACL55312.1 threonine synthase [Methylobacterium nodulans ORS 2060]
MLHVSTRGAAAKLTFTDALLAGLARDGGLYLPERWPALDPAAIAGLAGRPYAAAAKTVLSPLVDGEIPQGDLDRMIEGAYATFRHPAVCPLVQLGDNLFLLELHHGPTLAFKDVAMQLLGRLMDHVLKARGSRATIVGATSGDTGSAAVEAFRGLDQVDVFILFPHGRVSEVQRRQMTTVDSANVHAVAVEGTFDDCQAIVKALFQHPRFAEEVRLSGVNSINWARVAAQAVYYFTSAVALGSPHRPVSFSVPTGNFGDILAGWVAKRMGLPVGRLMIATNANDILARTLASGAYEVRGVAPTTSPSMDIQVSSNFERLLFEALDREPEGLNRLMASLKQSGAFSLPPAVLERVRAEFDAAAVQEPEVAAEIRETYRSTGYVLDPHSAIGVRAGRRLLDADPATPVVALATAHAAKFPDAVEAATGQRPALPPHLADLMTRRERFAVLPNDEGAVERFIRERARILRGAAA